MESINNMEIASSVVAHPNIFVKHGFLGFSTKLYYRPTLALVDCIRKYYPVATGDAIQQFLIKFQCNPQCAENTKLSMNYDPNGSYRLEMCVARDHQFIALQLSRYSDLDYNPVTDVSIFEEKEAELLCKVLVK